MVNKMENIYEFALLLDLYGQLLTQRQYEILDLHYNNDYSLGEIAEHLGISRQGVYDNLKRGKEILINAEKKLKLLEKHFVQKSIAEKILYTVECINIENMVDDDRKKVGMIKDYVNKLLETI